MKELQDLVKSSPQAFVEAANGVYQSLFYSTSDTLSNPLYARFSAWLVNAIESGSAWISKLLADAPKELIRWKNIFMYQVKKSVKAKLFESLQDVDDFTIEEPTAQPLEPGLPKPEITADSTEEDLSRFLALSTANNGYVVASDTATVETLYKSHKILKNLGFETSAARVLSGAIKLAAAMASKPNKTLLRKYFKL